MFLILGIFLLIYTHSLTNIHVLVWGTLGELSMFSFPGIFCPQLLQFFK